MHCAKFSPQATDLSQSLSSLPLDGWQSKEILFDKFPGRKLFGKRFRHDVEFAGTDLAYDFKIIRISGHVIWKSRPSRDANTKVAKLKIKRLRASLSEENVFGELRLAEYDGTCSPGANGFIKQSFDLPADLHEFWQQGKKGMLVSCYIGLSFCC